MCSLRPYQFLTFKKMREQSQFTAERGDALSFTSTVRECLRLCVLSQGNPATESSSFPGVGAHLES